TFAVVNWAGETRKLLLFHTSDQQLVRTVSLGKQTQGNRLFARAPAFSPDGRWLAVITQEYPDRRLGLETSALDFAQPRIHLIDVVSGTIREALVAPQGIATEACFSPDGRTLATAGYGRVLLWDLAGLGN